ncbi:adenylate/guanylate cyclase domain-containing protein [Fontisphaera persica]|uniref:adenylate/guanylate cyclase domain-containing protein n=1 Tax=Fontisphaera persica TaxID=2974023 RepID=UPI0024BF6754|nr:adenylate/guanylate cyclase domain-containing protein [Fontisphaera persica]WCJ58502.1 adenylate/guanylate cyclase domain-containing protein [Fontisphaera persica]
MNPSTPQRRLAAIMFADVCGYSRIMGENEQRAMRILACFDDVFTRQLQQHEGRLIKRLGDGILAEFYSAVAAVQCALSVQRALAEHNAQAPPEDQFQVRIGVHLGDVLVSGGDILGDGVNVASRIEPLAEPGGICISQDVYHQVHNKMEIQAVSLGPQQLKNIQRQIEIYRVLVAAAECQSAATVSAEESQPDNPPVPPSVEPGEPVAARRRKWPWVVAALFGLLLLLALVAALLQQVQSQRAQRAEKEARQLLNQGETERARRLLENTLRGLGPHTPGRGKLAQMLQEIRDEELKQHLRRRFEALVATFHQKNWDAAAQFASPESKMRLGMKNIAGRMALLGVFADVLKIKPGDFRLRDLILREDRQRAVIVPEMRVGNAWNPQQPIHWQYLENEWWVVIE